MLFQQIQYSDIQRPYPLDENSREQFIKELSESRRELHSEISPETTYDDYYKMTSNDDFYKLLEKSQTRYSLDLLIKRYESLIKHHQDLLSKEQTYTGRCLLKLLISEYQYMLDSVIKARSLKKPEKVVQFSLPDMVEQTAKPTQSQHLPSREEIATRPNASQNARCPSEMGLEPQDKKTASSSHSSTPAFFQSAPQSSSNATSPQPGNTNTSAGMLREPFAEPSRPIQESEKCFSWC